MQQETENFSIIAGVKLPGIECENDPSDITFYINDNDEVLKICENGDFIVNGNKVTEDIEVYNVMKTFITHIKGVLMDDLHRDVIKAINNCFNIQQ